MSLFPEWGPDGGARRSAFEAACRQASRSVYVGAGISLAKVLERYYMYLQVVDSGIGHHLLYDGFWESWVTLGVRSCLRPGMRFVDVGSNHGYYCLVAAHELGPLGTVYSFEPQRALYTLQLRTVIANGLEARIFLKNAAVGDRAGTAALSVPTEWSGGATLLAEPLDAFGETSSEEVEVLTLDDVFAGKSVDFVKVDVEGAEPQVIAGMRQVLDENPDIQLGLEWHGGPRAQSDMLGELADRGFIPHAINFSGDLHAVSYSWLHDLTFDPMIIFRRVTT